MEGIKTCPQRRITESFRLIIKILSPSQTLEMVNDQDMLRFMVIAIEPGIYIPNWDGVRIEDDVLITRRGCEILTTAKKKLLEL